ncbi:MAG: regulator of sigma protease, partial [candidate division NC10 bacterium]|nr:regulator of sigma protease [candidate division NC10 bacterium]
MQILETALYFIIVLGVLVFVHELGHFLAAKLFRMRVERFSIGFPPRAFGKQIGETDYCVSWVPIGGYVKIAGMIDESFDTDFLQKE